MPTWIAQKSKSYSDSEFIKKCIESVAYIICPGKKEEFSKISLSHQAIARWIDEIGKPIKEELEF